jgi:hypothetical protein
MNISNGNSKQVVLEEGNLNIYNLIVIDYSPSKALYPKRTNSKLRLFGFSAFNKFNKQIVNGNVNSNYIISNQIVSAVPARNRVQSAAYNKRLAILKRGTVYESFLGQPEEVIFSKGRQRMSSASQNVRKSKRYDRNYQTTRVSSTLASKLLPK